MKKQKVNNDKNLFEDTANYVDNARRIPRVRSFFWLLRCADALNKYAGLEVGTKGDSRTGLAVLQILIQHPEGISQQGIAEQTGRTKQLIVIAIDKLEEKGYVLRDSLDSDRRVNYIRITNAGIEHLNEVFPHTVAMCDQALSSLTDAQVQQLLPLTKKLTKGLWAQLKAMSPDNK
jgi:MarR family 2-MHQ and catechol resistance regulon transcriptional repressor